MLLLIDLNRDTEKHMIHTFLKIFADCERLMPSEAFGNCTSNRTLTFRDINLQGTLPAPPMAKAPRFHRGKHINYGMPC